MAKKFEKLKDKIFKRIQKMLGNVILRREINSIGSPSQISQGKVELEVCLSKLSNKFLRTPPNSLFQERLEDLICKKY